MTRKIFGVLALVFVVACNGKDRGPTDPGPVGFERYYVDFFAYAANGSTQGQPMAGVIVNFRDQTWSKFGQLTTASDGHAPRQEWPGAPGPLNVDARMTFGPKVNPYHAEGDSVTCHADPLHSTDAICTYSIPMYFELAAAK